MSEDVRAYAWCLIDLLKQREAGEDAEVADLVNRLRQLEPPSGDEVLAKHRNYQLKRFQPNAHEIARAVNCSRAKDFLGAVQIYETLFHQGDLARESQTNFAWDLYNRTKEILGTGAGGPLLPRAAEEVRHNLNLALKLDVERPSLCHSLFLDQALKLATANHLNINTAIFLRHWGLEYLRPDDFERYLAENGKSLPSRAERAIQRAAKEAIDKNSCDAMRFLLPHVEMLMARFSDNPWPCFYKVKLLRSLGEAE